MAIFTLLKLTNQKCSLYSLLTIDQSRLSSISFNSAVLSLSFTFFLFFNLNILTNMIKTEKVTVSTSEFIDSISKLNRSTKTLITLDEDSMNIFLRMFKKRKKGDAQIVSLYDELNDIISKVTKNGLDSYFYFMGEIYFFLLINDVSSINISADHIAFAKSTIYFETLRAIFYRKNLDQKMKKILNNR